MIRIFVQNFFISPWDFLMRFVRLFGEIQWGRPYIASLRRGFLPFLLLFDNYSYWGKSTRQKSPKIVNFSEIWSLWKRTQSDFDDLSVSFHWNRLPKASNLWNILKFSERWPISHQYRPVFTKFGFQRLQTSRKY